MTPEGYSQDNPECGKLYRNSNKHPSSLNCKGRENIIDLESLKRHFNEAIHEL